MTNSPPSSPSPQTLLAPMPGYQNIPPRAPLISDPPPAPSASYPYSDEPPAAVSDWGSTEQGPARARTPTKGPISARRAAPYEALARGGLQALGGALNWRLAVDDEDPSWLPDDEDDKMIPPPAGRIIARRVPIDPERADVDEIEDMAAAAIGLALWAIKSSIAMWQNRRRIRAERHGAAIHPANPDDGQ